MAINIQIQETTYTDEEKLIQDFIPFIVKTVSSVVKRYVTLENDEEFSVGIHAFYEAAQRYTKNRGHFLPFAKLVIKSRVLNSLKANKKNDSCISLDNEKYKNITDSLESQFGDPALEGENVIADEIKRLDTILQDFSFALKDLAILGPKQRQTRENAVAIGRTVQADKPLTLTMYEKKRLPITEISVKYQFTVKILKVSKLFIITVIVIIDKKLRNLSLWLNNNL